MSNPNPGDSGALGWLKAIAKVMDGLYGLSLMALVVCGLLASDKLLWGLGLVLLELRSISNGLRRPQVSMLLVPKDKP